MEIILYFCIPILVSFFVQRLIGCKTKHKTLRYIPLYCFAVCLAFSAAAFTADTGFLIGGNIIAALVWALMGACFLAGYALALLVHRRKP